MLDAHKPKILFQNQKCYVYNIKCKHPLLNKKRVEKVQAPSQAIKFFYSLQKIVFTSNHSKNSQLSNSTCKLK